MPTPSHSKTWGPGHPVLTGRQVPDRLQHPQSSGLRASLGDPTPEGSSVGMVCWEGRCVQVLASGWAVGGADSSTNCQGRMGGVPEGHSGNFLEAATPGRCS